MHQNTRTWSSKGTYLSKKLGQMGQKLFVSSKTFFFCKNKFKNKTKCDCNSDLKNEKVQLKKKSSKIQRK